MYEVTLYVGTQAVAGFDNLRFWSQVKGTVIGLEGHYDLQGYDTRCVVTYTDATGTVKGWATDGATMERPYRIEGMKSNDDEYSTLVFDLEQAEAIADSLSYARVYDLTRCNSMERPVYLGGCDRDSSRILVDTVGNQVYPF